MKVDFYDLSIKKAATSEGFRRQVMGLWRTRDALSVLGQLFTDLKSVLPLDEMIFSCIDTGLSAIRRMVRVTPKGAKKIQEVLAMSEELWDWELALRAPLIIQYSGDMPGVPSELFSVVDVKPRSEILMPLHLDDAAIGFLVLRTKTENYTQAHLDEVAPLTGPLALVLAHSMALDKLQHYKSMLTSMELGRDVDTPPPDPGIIMGSQSGMAEILALAKSIAPLNSTVLLRGETGTGKELIASIIHSHSERSSGPFVKVNCGAIPESLVDSELFGHEKGAFTGALARKIGRFERASGGTIFLDEIGELPLSAQVRLLRVLQQREIERVGGEESITLDIRVIAATHAPLEDMVREKKFREDLWFRLNVFPLNIPPLRDRSQDIPLLIRYFLRMKCLEMGIASMPEIAPGILHALTEYHWPGNVRELENMIERELILHRSRGSQMTFPMITGRRGQNTSFISDLPSPENGQGSESEEAVSLDDAVRAHIEKVLQKTRGRISGPAGAAAILKVHANTLRAKMDKLGVNYKKK